MANEGFNQQLTHEPGAHRVGSVRNTVFAGIILLLAGVVLVWLFMFLLSHG